MLYFQQKIKQRVLMEEIPFLGLQSSAKINIKIKLTYEFQTETFGT